jgi:hypothetical protein
MKVRRDRDSGQIREFDRGQHNWPIERPGNFQPDVPILQWSLCERHASETRKVRHGALTGWELSIAFDVVGLHARRLHEQFVFLNPQKSAKQMKEMNEQKADSSGKFTAEIAEIAEVENQ